MASVQFKKMNWFQKRPIYKVMDAWRDKRRAELSDVQAVLWTTLGLLFGVLADRSFAKQRPAH